MLRSLKRWLENGNLPASYTFVMRGTNDSADNSARHVKKQEQEKTQLLNPVFFPPTKIFWRIIFPCNSACISLLFWSFHQNKKSTEQAVKTNFLKSVSTSIKDKTGLFTLRVLWNCQKNYRTSCFDKVTVGNILQGTAAGLTETFIRLPTASYEKMNICWDMEDTLTYSWNTL